MMTVVASIFVLASCKDDENPTFAAPTITVGTTAVDALPGQEVSTDVTVDSPAGGKTLNIIVTGTNAGTVAPVTLDGTESQKVTVKYTVPANATVGANYTLTFSSVDNANQNSTPATFTVTVSDKPSKPTKEISAAITKDRHFVADTIYILTGLIDLGTDTKDAPGKSLPTVKATATLTIDPGTVIYGAPGTPGGGLIVHRGSKIIAEGTAENPIIFTSKANPGAGKTGDWAGLVLCGKAFNNIKNSGSTGVDGVEELEGAYGGYHGNGAESDDADNSGTLKYVRVEFAGYPINPNQEINGITFGSVGSGTTIDYVQVSYSNDDSYEWFGGKVNASHLIAYKGVDDDFDTDNGFSGRVQFGLGIRDAQTADQSGSNGFESDNDSHGSTNQPFTDATFANMTIIGGKKAQNTTIDIQFQNGAQIRRNSRIDLINVFITAYPNGIYLDDQAAGTIANATNGDLILDGVVLAGVKNWGGNGFGSAARADEQTALEIAAGAKHPVAPNGFSFNAGVGAFASGVYTLNTPKQINGLDGLPWFFDSGNTIYTSWDNADLGLDINGSFFTPASSTPIFIPAATSVLVKSTGGFGVDVPANFTTAKYVGAFNTTDWTSVWSNWDPQSADYSKSK